MTSSSAGISSNVQMNQRNHKAPKFQGCVLLWICLMPAHTSTSSCEPGSLGTKQTNNVRWCKTQQEVVHLTTSTNSTQQNHHMTHKLQSNTTSSTSAVLLTNVCVTSNMHVYSVSSSRFFLNFSLFLFTSLNSVSSFCSCSCYTK